MDKLKGKLQSLLRRSGPNITAARVRRRKAIVSAISRNLLYIRLSLFFVGFAWMAALPLPPLGQGTFIDEHALQPGQANTYWDWEDVHAADQYLELLESLRDSNATNEQRAQFLVDEFRKMGIPAATQKYTFKASTGVTDGINAYASLSTARTSGTEAMVISASWLSLSNREKKLNLRGISTVLALAPFIKQYSFWAKDILFVISDGHLDGMHAFLAAYHGNSQTNLEAEAVALSSGVIWTALNIDYPGHSFSHLGMFFEGLNGRLPNQDLINSFQHIAVYTAGVPVMLYDHVEREDGSAVPWRTMSGTTELSQYVSRARNILRHVGYQARGRPSGVHGLFHQFRIDAITIFAVPATGPHGFYAIGRAIESTLRTTNNLLERLHASFFFYVLTSAGTFLKIGKFLPSAVLISVAMMFGGLRTWVDAAWTRGALEQLQVNGKVRLSQATDTSPWRRRRRHVVPILFVMMSTHAIGLALFLAINKPWSIEHHKIIFPTLYCIITAVPVIYLSVPPLPTAQSAPPSLLLKALNLCVASTVVSTMTVLNFSLAATMAVLLGVPLSLASASRHFALRVFKYSFYMFLGFGWLLVGHEEARKALWHWEMVGGWYAPFMCIVYGPLALQAGIVSLLP